MQQGLWFLVNSWCSTSAYISLFLGIKKQIEKNEHGCYTYLSKRALTKVNNFCLNGNGAQPIVEHILSNRWR